MLVAIISTKVKSDSNTPPKINMSHQHYIPINIIIYDIWWSFQRQAHESLIPPPIFHLKRHPTAPKLTPRSVILKNRYWYLVNYV